MLFPSFPFLLWFLPLTLLAYYSVRDRYRIPVLLLASYIFYAWWDPRFCILMLLTTSIDFYAGQKMSKTRKKSEKWPYLTMALTGNLLLLAFFKYFTMARLTLEAMGGVGVLPSWSIVLPVGISFYTFQSMSYTIDLYRGKAKPTKSFLDFACYVSLFPQLVAGPIVRYAEISDQLQKRLHMWDNAAEGVYRFIVGLVKKVLIADLFAVIADAAFAAESLSTIDAWLGAFAYALQIYFDFSAYSDMAIGLGLLFGFRFPENFKFPYHAKSIGEFWHRWHMTLSRFFRDYLYIPLGGSKSGSLLTLRNLLITMFLAGLWHGAAWTFVAWGLYFGVLLVVERVWRKQHASLPSPVRQSLTFFLVLMGWVLFRSVSFTDAISYYQSLFSLDLATFSMSSLLLCVLGALLVVFEPRVPRVLTSYDPWKAMGLGALLLCCLLVIAGNTASPFIYFQF